MPEPHLVDHPRPLPGRRCDRAIRPRRELALTRASLVVTIVGLVLFEVGMVGAAADAFRSGGVRQTVEGALFAAIVSFLVYGNLVYQTSRLGYLTRRRDHRVATRGELDELYDAPLGHCWR